VRNEDISESSRSDVNSTQNYIINQNGETSRGDLNSAENNVTNSVNSESSNNDANVVDSTMVNSEIWNFGKPTFKCRHCNALLWYEERLQPNKHTKKPSFGICCKNGKIKLPSRPESLIFLQQLLNGDDQRSKNFRKNIRSYNSMFTFISTGGIVDKEINKEHGPYVFRMHGQNYQHIGTLLPEEGSNPRWAQLYIYDTKHEVENIINVSKGDGEKSSIDPTIVAGLKKMLDEHNILAKAFRMA
jgi:hypothetical protein